MPNPSPGYSVTLRVDVPTSINATAQLTTAAAVPVALPPVVVVGGGVGAGREGLAQAGCAVAGADVAVPADGVGELDEPAVLLGDLEVDQPARRARPRNALDLLCHGPCTFRWSGSVFGVQLQARRCRRWRHGDPGVAGAAAGGWPRIVEQLGQAPPGGQMFT